MEVVARTLGCPLKPAIRRALGKTTTVFPPDTNDLIRGDLFGIERLEQHAGSLAAAQPVATSKGVCRRLTRRLKDNGETLFAAFQHVAQAVRDERAITPADEWLFDNVYVAQEQIRQVRRDLPHGFCRGLPTLASDPLEGDPRVFGLGWALVAHTDSRLDRETLVRFVNAYQRVQPLTIGELWGVPIMLRIVLVENLRRSADQMARGRAACREAEAAADALLGVGGLAAEVPEAVLNPSGVTRGVLRVSVDGAILESNGSQILLSDDGATHTVEVMLG